VEVRSVDLNADGTNELLIFERAEQWKPAGTFTKVSVYKEGAKDYELLGSFSTDPRPDWCVRLPFSRYQLVDFDRDGRLDFLGSDTWAYRQGQNFRFEKAVKIDLRNGDGRAQLFAYDVNSDGWGDVVSSYQPFWNIRLGPIFGEAGSKAPQ
jgi:hypothetical protein